MRSFCCSSLGLLMFFPKEIILLHKEEQQNDLVGEKHQRA
jgi:hypothetical protein